MTTSKKTTSASSSKKSTTSKTLAKTSFKKSEINQNLSKTGVITSIVECVVKSGRKGILKDAVLKVLVKKFPDRNPEQMKKTLQVQIPNSEPKSS